MDTLFYPEKIANRNHYPAIDILASVSRAMPNIVSKEHLQLSNKIKELLSIYNESEDLINIGAYVEGTNKKVDEAISKIEAINEFLRQDIQQKSTFDEAVDIMQQ